MGGETPAHGLASKGGLLLSCHSEPFGEFILSPSAALRVNSVEGLKINSVKNLQRLGANYGNLDPPP